MNSLTAASQPDSLAGWLAVARQNVLAYNQIFRDLTATETRTTELFERDGQADGKRVTVADLIVYQSRFDEKVIHECRLFTSIDGKPVNTSEKALLNFFARAAKAQSPEQERRLFHERNTEHFFHFYRFNRTISPAWMLEHAEWEARFDFTIAGREQWQGHETLILAYRQKETTPLDERELIRRMVGGDFKNALRRWRGRIRLDATSGHIWRLEQESALEYADTPTPLVVLREVMDFTPSEYGIHVPKRFVADFNFHSWRAKDGARKLALRCRFTDEYSVFRRFNTSGQEEGKQQIIK